MEKRYRINYSLKIWRDYNGYNGYNGSFYFSPLFESL